jgi:hypothetical protein
MVKEDTSLRARSALREKAMRRRPGGARREHQPDRVAAAQPRHSGHHAGEPDATRGASAVSSARRSAPDPRGLSPAGLRAAAAGRPGARPACWLDDKRGAARSGSWYVLGTFDYGGPLVFQVWRCYELQMSAPEWVNGSPARPPRMTHERRFRTLAKVGCRG